jgi:dTDP-6-deoxy-L-talose 4-dehydrogenase (NAD+)
MRKTADEKMSKPQIIVSGATGFIGQHLIPLLLQAGHEIVAIGRDKDKARRFNWHDRVQFVALDYHHSTQQVIPKAGACLVHLAWQGLPNYKSLFHFEENLPKNYAFIKALVEAGVTKVLVTGTCFEYGFQSGPISAKHPTMPANPYALAKDCLRKYLESLQKEHPFTLQWARLFYMHGKGQNPNSILAQLDAAIAKGESHFNMSGGEQLRDYLPVEEVALQLSQILEQNENGIFNVCSGKPISIRRLVENRIKEKASSIRMNLGYYPYSELEPMAFWGKK